MPHPWKHSRSGWTGLWTTWPRWRCPCSLQGHWTRRPLKVPSNSNYCMILWFIITLLFREACNPRLVMSWTGPLFPQKGRQSNAYPLFNKSCWIRSESKVTDFPHFLSLINQSSHPSCYAVRSVVFHFYRELNTAKNRLNLILFPPKMHNFFWKGRESRNYGFPVSHFHSYHDYFQTLVRPVLWEPCAVRTPYVALLVQEIPMHLGGPKSEQDWLQSWRGCAAGLHWYSARFGLQPSQI